MFVVRCTILLPSPMRLYKRNMLQLRSGYARCIFSTTPCHPDDNTMIIYCHTIHKEATTSTATSNLDRQRWDCPLLAAVSTSPVLCGKRSDFNIIPKMNLYRLSPP
jgi:hypothetical protein